jgi:uncharacterized protein YndB with AHSA1/START domain
MNDQREIRLEVEVPGTPEQVWDAVATGPGITSWFVPSEVAEHEGGAVSMDFGTGAAAAGVVSAWEPPHRFAYRAPEDQGSLAFEWLIEARSGGTCVVRLVNSGFGAGAEWDAEYDGMDAGWRLFLHNLLLYLTHFAGQPCTAVLVSGAHPEPREPAWEDYAAALGIAGAAEGDHVETPLVAGTVARREGTMLTLLLDQPGYCFFAAEGSGEQAFLSAWFYLFGDVAADTTATWRAWMEERYPSAIFKNASERRLSRSAARSSSVPSSAFSHASSARRRRSCRSLELSSSTSKTSSTSTSACSPEICRNPSPCA